MLGISLDCDHDRHPACRRKLADGTCVVSCACGCHGDAARAPLRRVRVGDEELVLHERVARRVEEVAASAPGDDLPPPP